MDIRLITSENASAFSWDGCAAAALSYQIRCYHLHKNFHHQFASRIVLWHIIKSSTVKHCLCSIYLNKPLRLISRFLYLNNVARSHQDLKPC